MPLLARLKLVYRRLSRSEKALLILLLVYVAWNLLWPSSAALLQIPLYLLGAWVAIRLTRRLLRKAIWRLRNRLVLCYILIGVVPVVLIAVLAGIGMWLLTGQVAVYLVTARLEERINALEGPAQGLLALPAPARADRLRWMAPYFQERFPGLEFYIRDGAELRYPPDATLGPPPEGWRTTRGLVLKQGRVYAWVHVVRDKAEVIWAAPLSRDTLANLVPKLGDVALLIPRASSAAESGGKPGTAMRRVRQEEGEPGRQERLPPPVNGLDIAVSWATEVSIANWDRPGQASTGLLQVRSRPSAVLRTISIQKAQLSQLAQLLFLSVAVAFLIVELVSLVIGASLTRTITGAVHNLYEGTRKVMQGEFTHRIEARGQDQLADLSRSFNLMTGNLERLVAVAKEKERLQAELEIAREVQNQLFPKTVPELETLRVMARCNPARLVSGDYYDYQALRDSQIALAFGDVAGKGISAALLMATVQSSFRTQIQACLEAATSGGAGRDGVSTSRLVVQLNQQLYAHSAPEKFSTFYFGVYDETTSMLTYTNAGHLPPVLIRRGESLRLEVNGVVVGAFPFSLYGEDRLRLESGDLLVCFTDGITEPENEYGEMFGEERLIEILIKNAQRESADIIDAVIQAVGEWTGSPELQDDMTLLVARRV